MRLEPYDLHLIFSAAPGLLSVWDAAHIKKLECEARNRTTADGQIGHDGNCPPGIYLLGTPVVKNTVPFGPWFIGMEDFGDNHGMRDRGRSGIGLHGGGSGLPSPLSPRQGWQVTHGCIRLQNEDLWRLIGLVRPAQQQGGRCYITVGAPAPRDWGEEKPSDWSFLAPDE